MDKLVHLEDMPDVKGQYKIVQLYYLNEPYLLFGSGTNRMFHIMILQEFLEKKGITPEVLFVKREDGQKEGIPHYKGNDYGVVGMGGLEIIDASKKVFGSFYGKSYDYRDYISGIDKAHKELTEKTLTSLGWIKF